MEKIGNMEHLHIYCTSPILTKTREYCHTRIEAALHALYNSASIHEFATPLATPTRKTILQENMEDAAAAVERQERTIVQHSNIVLASRESNIAILRQHALTEAILLNRLPASKMQDYLRFPLASRLGVIHCIPEESFNMAMATIIDVGFMGLFPKALLQVLNTYMQNVKRTKPEMVQTFQVLTDALISAFIYRTISMQQVIQIMLAKERKNLDGITLPNKSQEDDHIHQMTDAHQHTLHSQNELLPSSTPAPPPPTEQRNKICHAVKCRLLRAKGIVSQPMKCVGKKNMCAGCMSESI
jgi:hypothetical protein